jgi:uncharacterized integral membrane protein
MGSKRVFQPLTREEKVTVVLYRIGIVLSAISITTMSFLLKSASSNPGSAPGDLVTDLLVYDLFASVGMSVFFIHLYIRKFKGYLKNLYFISLACLAVLLYIGKGTPSYALIHAPSSSLFLLPLSMCLGFVTAKEAFCFKLFEGYLLAMIMPIYLLLIATSALDSRGAFYGLVLIAAVLIFFTLRKVFMPIAYDIGDKSAYQ